MATHNDDIDARFAEMAAQLKAQAEVNAQLMAALEAKAPVGISADQLSAILKETSKSSELLASKYKPEVIDPVPRSPFEHPRGGVDMPKPPLQREMVFCGFRLRDQEISYAEAMALNALSASLDRSQRRVCHDGLWSAEVNDRNDRLTIHVPYKTMDDRANLPGMLQIAMELTSGERVPDQNDVLAELALLRQQVAKLQGAPA